MSGYPPADSAGDHKFDHHLTSKYTARIICYYLLLTDTCRILSVTEDAPMAERRSSKPKKSKTARWQRIAMMDKEILDVEGAATLLGVSTTTICHLARNGDV